MSEELRALLVALADWLYSITSIEMDADEDIDLDDVFDG
jgi:hypothetical protein